MRALPSPRPSELTPSFCIASRAPPSILNIQPGQHVELRIARRTTEDYVPPSSSAASRSAFGGAGHRLGSPVPAFAAPAASAPAVGSDSMPGGFPNVTTTSASASGMSAGGNTGGMGDGSGTRFEVDNTLPTTRVQIRLADGSRMTARMNLVHRVRDLRGFVDACV